MTVLAETIGQAAPSYAATEAGIFRAITRDIPRNRSIACVAVRVVARGQAAREQK